MYSCIPMRKQQGATVKHLQILTFLFITTLLLPSSHADSIQCVECKKLLEDEMCGLDYHDSLKLEVRDLREKDNIKFSKLTKQQQTPEEKAKYHNYILKRKDEKSLHDKDFSSSRKTAKAFIEIPRGCSGKWEVKKNGTLKWDKKKGKVRLFTTPYPIHYGMFTGTKSGDGDPLDVAIISNQPLKRGQLVEIEIIDILVALDKAKDNQGNEIWEKDDKLVAVIAGDKDYPKDWKKTVWHWFDTYKGPNEMKLIEYAGKRKARKKFKSAIKKYTKEGNLK